jgi:ubiquinone/menaquinone biosynthesis C-methylase UbiE
MANMNFVEKALVNSRAYNWFYRRTYLRRFLDFCDLRGKCLEIGCGAGFTSREIMGRFAVELTSTDYDPEQVKEAKARLRGRRVKVRQADATALPFRDGSFDCAVELNTFHHISRYKDAIGEVYRVLKKGGKFYLMDISRYTFWPLTLLIPFEHFDGKFTKDQMVSELEEAGFSVLRKKGRNLFLIECLKRGV